jgi:hypothetical protein
MNYSHPTAARFSDRVMRSQKSNKQFDFSATDSSFTSKKMKVAILATRITSASAFSSRQVRPAFDL